jgi:tetratricopeptide (TPR) repeat protein
VKSSRAILILLLLLAVVFSLGTVLQLRTPRWTHRSPSESVLALLFGESRQLFANHFFVKADISFHSGYYPSIFDEARQAEENDNDVSHPDEKEEPKSEGGFLGPPTDWIDRFGRHFRPTLHTHLQGGNIREILPWLRISAELDPHRIEAYTVASYWMRKHLGKVDEAEQFLREGLRANPDSYELLFELGNLYYDNRHDAGRARNVWLAALRLWQKQESGKGKPDNYSLDQITVHLAHLEELEGNLNRAVEYFEMAEKVSPDPSQLQKQIDEITRRLPRAGSLSPR